MKQRDRTRFCQVKVSIHQGRYTSEVIIWVEQKRVPEKTETRGKARKVLVACSMLDPEVFKMKDGVLMYLHLLFWFGLGWSIS